MGYCYIINSNICSYLYILDSQSIPSISPRCKAGKKFKAGKLFLESFSLQDFNLSYLMSLELSKAIFGNF